MKLRVVVKPHLILVKEKMTKNYGEIFEVDEERGDEILKATFEGNPVAELVVNETETSNEEMNAKKGKKKGDRNE